MQNSGKPILSSVLRKKMKYKCLILPNICICRSKHIVFHFQTCCNCLIVFIFVFVEAHCLCSAFGLVDMDSFYTNKEGGVKCYGSVSLLTVPNLLLNYTSVKTMSF